MANTRGIDLHAHTIASDGSLTPTELVELAAQANLAALAVTDHDTLSGIAEASEAARGRSLELIPGIELNVTHTGRFHLLGYLFRPEDPELGDRLRFLQEYRASRNVRMVERLQTHGLPVSMEDVKAEAGGDLIGRPHMALALMRKGVVGSVQEAFDRFLGDGAICHVPKEKVTPEEGMALVRGAGGVPVVAHPLTLKLDWEELESALRRWKDAGLGGLECYYSQHSAEQQRLLVAMAQRTGLAPTGGSDFHGASKPNVRLGLVTEGRPASYELLDGLRAAVI